tara:strand:+ start:263 stop:502 length:240 start_codon:yes stop_codon:yes gene_type:complete
MSKFFNRMTVDELINMAAEPIDYSSYNDVQMLNHMRQEASLFLYENEQISEHSRKFLEKIVEQINDEKHKLWDGQQDQV